MFLQGLSGKGNENSWPGERSLKAGIPDEVYERLKKELEDIEK